MSDFSAVFGDWLEGGVSVAVLPLAEPTMEGSQYGAPQSVPDVMVERTARLVRNSDGVETLSETTLYVAPGQATFSAGDRVQLGDEITTVIRVALMEPFGLFDHVVVNLE